MEIIVKVPFPHCFRCDEIPTLLFIKSNTDWEPRKWIKFKPLLITIAAFAFQMELRLGRQANHEVIATVEIIDNITLAWEFNWLLAQ